MAEIGESMSLVFVVEETAYRPRAVALYIGVVVHPGLSLAQEHAPGAFGILGELQVLVDAHAVGHALHVEIVGTDDARKLIVPSSIGMKAARLKN